jgi:hypothetical protein
MLFKLVLVLEMAVCDIIYSPVGNDIVQGMLLLEGVNTVRS